MSHRVLIGIFDSEDAILEVTDSARRRGLKIVDVFAPYAVHGLDKAMGLQRSKLPWVCFALGLFGASFKVWFEYWTTASDWPINVGGKPWNSLPAFVPITFEVMVLFAGISTVLAFFGVSRLWPGRKVAVLDRRVTNDHFALVLEEDNAAFDVDEVERFLRAHHAIRVEEREQEAAA
jgi:hypothetical protein